MSSGFSTPSTDSHPTQIPGQGQELSSHFLSFFPLFPSWSSSGSLRQCLSCRISRFSLARGVNFPKGKGRGRGMSCCHESQECQEPCQELSHRKSTARAVPSLSPGVLKEELHFGFKDVPTSNEGRASMLPLINKLAHQEAP